ncbi:urease accessory protein UreF [Sneathiella sp.]|uniref:urease accessory protein UreF n=1 Tax=Sneathiella sp. TaxID=1964365 RepID=UPI003564B96B
MARRKAMIMAMVAPTVIAMDNRALFHLMSWMSPSYPVGAYTYSHGLEYAVEVGLITGLGDLVPWIADILEHGDGKSDSILLAAAHRAARNEDLSALREVAELGYAFCSTAELALETTAQGRAFTRVISDVATAPSLEALQGLWNGPLVHPLVLAIVAADHDIGLPETLTAYLHGFVSNLVSAAVRIIPLGQTDGQRAIAGLAGDLARTVRKAESSTLENLGTATLMVDWCSSLHETQYTRLFRS